MPPELRRVDEEIRRAGYAFVPGSVMAAGLQVIGLGKDWETFAASWDDLGFDQYMADGGRYRRRRFACSFPESDQRLQETGRVEPLWCELPHACAEPAGLAPPPWGGIRGST